MHPPTLEPVDELMSSADMPYPMLIEDGMGSRIITPVRRPEDDCERVPSLEQVHSEQLPDGPDVVTPSETKEEEECKEQILENPISSVEPPPLEPQLPAEDSVTANPSKEDPGMLLEMSHLRAAEDGVRLRIITPMKKSEDDCERVLNLEQVCGQLQDGLDVIPSDINEEECREQMQVNPVSYVEPPPFGSHLPTKDSTFANLSKEDSEMLLEIYGSETGYEYAESLQCFASGTNYSNRMVGSLLNLLTDGEHRKVAEDEVQKQLDEIDALLNELKQVQEKRLSSSPSPVEPKEEETKLADEVIQKMTKLIKDKAKPGEICDSSAIFKALGVDLIN